MKKKILALCLVVVLAVTAVTGATLAYFTDTEDVTNTFTVGNIDIKLDEKDIDGNGRTEDGNQYDDMYPGVVLEKDPTVTVLKNSEDCYVRLLVEVDEYEQLTKAFPQAKYGTYYGADNTFLLQNLVDWNTAWEYAGFEDGVYEFRYNAIVAEASTDTVLPALFTQVTIPTALTNTELAELESIKIVITANAIQSATFANADAAWTAFES